MNYRWKIDGLCLLIYILGIFTGVAFERKSLLMIITMGLMGSIVTSAVINICRNRKKSKFVDDDLSNLMLEEMMKAIPSCDCGSDGEYYRINEMNCVEHYCESCAPKDAEIDDDVMDLQYAIVLCQQAKK